MKKQILYAMVTFSILLTSCGEKKKDIEAEIQYFNEVKVNKEQADIEKDGLMPELYQITQPINIDDVSYVFSPLFIKRVDDGKKFEMDYLSKKGRNYKKINAITRAHREYFKDGNDTEIQDGLTAPSQQKIDFDVYVNQNKTKENYFFIDFNGNLKIDGEEAPSSAEQLTKKIEKYIRSKQEKDKKGKHAAEVEIDKIVIVVTPNYYAANVQEPVQPADTSTQIINTPLSPIQQPEQLKPANKKDNIKEGGQTPTTSACQQQHPSFDKFFAILTDKSISSNCKSDMIKKDYLKYFTSDAQIENVHNGDCEGQAQDISGFLTTYINSGYHIYLQNCNTDIKTGGRYKLLHVQVIRAK